MALDPQYTEDGTLVQPEPPSVFDCKTKKCKFCKGPWAGSLYACDDPCDGTWLEWVPEAQSCWTPCEGLGFLGGGSTGGQPSTSPQTDIIFVGGAGEGESVTLTALVTNGGKVTFNISGAISLNFELERSQESYIFYLPVTGTGAITVTTSPSPSTGGEFETEGDWPIWSFSFYCNEFELADP